MKRSTRLLLLLSGLVIFSRPLYAQPLSRIREIAGYGQESLQATPFPLRSSGPSQPADKPSRLMATYRMVYDSAGYKPASDSIRFFWKGAASINAEQVAGIQHHNQIDLKPDYVFNRPISSDSVHYYNHQSAIPFGELKIRTNTIFDASGKVATELTQWYFPFTGVWENSSRHDYQYDAAGRITSNLLSLADAAGAWHNNTRYLFSYDQQGNVTGFEKSTWNSVAHNWARQSRISNTYDAQSNWITETRQDWDNTNNDWLNSEKRIYTYNAAQVRTGEMLQWYSIPNAQWKNHEQTRYVYNAAGLRIMDTSEVWIQEIPAWQQTTYNAYTYNASGDCDTMLTWLFIDGAWLENKKFEYQYAAPGGKLDHIIAADWIMENSTWELRDRLSLEYNSFNQITEIRSRRWNNGNWVDLQGTSLFRFFYEPYEGTTGINTRPEKSDIGLFPNPARDMLCIDGRGLTIDRITIYSMTGKTVFSTKGKVSGNIVTIPVAQLSPGNYIVHIDAPGSRFVHKITVVR